MASANPAATSAPLRNLPPVSSSTVSPPSAPAPSSLRQTSSWPSRSQGTSPPPTAASAHASSRLQHPARLGTAKSPLSRLNHFASWSWKKVASNPTVLITGVIIGVIAAVPTYRAYVIGQWTAWKDYIDYCRNVDMTTLAASKQQDCQRAIDVGLGPPPYTPLHRVKQTVNEMVLRARGVNEPSPPPAPPAYSSWAWTYKLFLALTVVPFVFFTFVMVFTFVSSWLAAGYYVSRQPLWGSVGRYRRVISQAAMSVAVLLGLVWSIQSYFSASKALQTSRENAMQEFLNYCSSVQVTTRSPRCLVFSCVNTAG
ncbi:hypothetical protein B0T26DRAFT_710840 [Lasiosphaeria miniovina]|uniref:Uncharacterized protein n=1 Tax=Lasiosphaeria miniovina TaxID=1954250 RepID=A0AA40AL07_9PEZI|nr:uncharacterized protein B0T26DRAFT_710840 [Lasiosphaeria miniovina]KAK0717774.1 hypothetical protein B0T26DRAFT_710840 [Lasiosphaeria miniovina]